MAVVTHWSDHFTLTQPTAQVLVPTPQVKAPWGVNNRHSKRASGIALVGSFDANSVMRMMTLRSIDRLTRLWFTSVGGTATVGHIGLYTAGSAHDGAIIGAGNHYANSLTMNGTVANADIFAQGTSANTVKRGQTVWELLGLASDPVLEYDLCITCTVTLTGTNPTFTLVADGSFH